MLKSSLLLVFALLLSSDLNAQVFGNSSADIVNNGADAEQTFQTPDFFNNDTKEETADENLDFSQSEYVDPLDNMTMFAENSATEDNYSDETVADNENADKEFVDPKYYKREVLPTTDGSKRGGMFVVELDDNGNVRDASKIFLYYDNFKIINSASGNIYCDVRFNLLSSLDTKITQLDMKIVWPKLTTTLSFSQVRPNVRNYYNYSLLGPGCYEMDKAPNIIVNRCRVKGMTAAECANKITWLTK